MRRSWGLEGAIAGRALDVTDPDVSVAIRFTAEPIYWFAIIFPLANLAFPMWGALGQVASNGWLMLLLVVAGMSFSWTYFTWYKSFPLVGVGRGQAIADMSGFTTILFTAIFTLVLPGWHLAAAAILTIGGAFIMYTEGSEQLETTRDTSALT